MMAAQKQSPISKTRMENLSDGFFAIVLTLLIFQLMSPLVFEAETAKDLHSGLVAIWPKFVSFTISFVIISVYWVGHHSYYHAVQSINDTQLWLNLLFLFCVAIIPFSAVLIGEHHDISVAGIIYGLNLMFATFTLRLNWWYASSRQLVSPNIDRAAIKQMHKRGVFNILTSLFVVVVACFNPVAAFYLYVVNAFGYLALQIYGQTLRKMEPPKQETE
jgi:uncharacterized membrane protein